MTTPVDPRAEREADKAAQLAEHGTWVAARQIEVGATVAYGIGHSIPASNVVGDGEVVIERHYCPPPIPGQPACKVENNTVVETTEPGAAVKVDQPKTSAKTPVTKKES